MIDDNALVQHIDDGFVPFTRAEMLMDGAPIAQIRQIAENPLHIFPGNHMVPAIGVHIDPSACEDIRPMCFPKPLQHSRKPLAVLCLHELIRIQKADPVPRGLLQRIVLRRGKIIDPRKFIRPDPRRTHDVQRAVRRAGIHDNQLLRGLPHAGDPAPDILFLILHNHTSRYLHTLFPSMSKPCASRIYTSSSASLQPMSLARRRYTRAFFSSRR